MIRPDFDKCNSCQYLDEIDNSCTFGPGCHMDDAAYDAWINQGIDQGIDQEREL